MFYCLRIPAHRHNSRRACRGFSLHCFPTWGTTPKIPNDLLGLTGFKPSSEPPTIWKQ